MSATHVNILGVAGGRVATVGAVASLLTGSNLSGYAVIAGGVIWAIATWRRDRRQVLLDEVKDLRGRNQTLEDDLKRKDAEIARAHAETEALKARPNLDGVAAVLTALATDLKSLRGEAEAQAQMFRGSMDDVTTTLAQLVQSTQALTTLVVNANATASQAAADRAAK